jgi:hypothetical protein
MFQPGIRATLKGPALIEHYCYQARIPGSMVLEYRSSGNP